jgi:putative intracellular protease/amidase
MGGMTVAPSLALEAIDVTTFDALVLCGGAAWRSAEAPQIGALVQAAHQAGRVVAGICDGTFALAKTGLLDGVAHTSNGAGYLDETGYAGAAHYRDSAGAVRDRGVVTAGGTAPVAFMLEVMAAIGLGDERLAYYAGLHAAQFRAAA